MAGTFERSLQFCSGSLNIEEDSQQPEESGTSLEGRGLRLLCLLCNLTLVQGPSLREIHRQRRLAAMLRQLKS